MNKYDWSNVPDQVQWIATDNNGAVFGYDSMPEEKDFGKFMQTSDFLYFPHNGWMPAYQGNWRDSLEKRLEGKRLEVNQ